MSYAKMNNAKEPIFCRAIAELLTTNTSVSAIWRKYKVSEFLVFNLEVLYRNFELNCLYFIAHIIVSFGNGSGAGRRRWNEKFWILACQIRQNFSFSVKISRTFRLRVTLKAHANFLSTLLFLKIGIRRILCKGRSETQLLEGGGGVNFKMSKLKSYLKNYKL